MVGLVVYKVKDKDTYYHLKSLLGGLCFFRHTKEEYFIKAPKTKMIEGLLTDGLITTIN